MRERRKDDSSDDHRRDRGQVILIGAITLAFIVLGVVVVFNGVLYTETLSSADTGQTASGAESAEIEIRQGVACLVAEYDEDELEDISDFGDSELHDEIHAYAEVYQNSTAHSQPAVVDVTPDSDFLDDLLNDGESATVIVTYNTNDLSYERTLEISRNDCPRSPTIEAFDVTQEDEETYTVDWAVSSRGSELSKVTISLVNTDDEVVAENTTESFDDEYSHDDQDTLESEDEISHIRIVVEDNGGYTASRTESVE